MKKMIMTVAIACAAVFSHGASVTWDSYADLEGGAYDGGQAYLVMVTDLASFAVGSNLSIIGGEVVDSTGILGGTIGGTWNDTGSLVNGTKYYFAIIGTTDGVAGKALPTSGSYGVDLNGGTGTESGFYEMIYSADTGGSLSINWADLNAGVFLTEPVAGVPEPTSGLLILVGASLLALRRKQK